MKTQNALGEREIIEIIQKQLDIMPRMPIPFGDDVSAYDIGNNDLAILKTDMLVGKTDVPPGMSYWQAARKAVVMNISDFAAKGVRPLAMLVSLGLPKGLAKKEIEEIGKGLNEGAREYETYVIGGDTGEASDLVISLSVFGVAKKGEVMLRDGARPGDLVAVTGLFGKTSAGLKVLTQGIRSSKKSRKILVESVLMPHARLREGLVLSRTRAITASTDSSDGLAWSLHEIARRSGVGMLVDKIPVASEAARFAREHKLDPTELALHGGEEYELVLTAKPDCWRKAEEAIKKVGGKLLRIGKVTDEKQVLFDNGKETRVIDSRGYEHFA